MSVQRTLDNSQIFINSWASSLAEPQHCVQHLRAPTSQLNVGTFVTSVYMKNPENQPGACEQQDWLGWDLPCGFYYRDQKQLVEARAYCSLEVSGPTLSSETWVSSHSRTDLHAVPERPLGDMSCGRVRTRGAKLRRTRKPEQKSLGSVLPLMHDLTGGTAGENQGAFYRVEGTDWLMDWLRWSTRQATVPICLHWLACGGLRASRHGHSLPRLKPLGQCPTVTRHPASRSRTGWEGPTWAQHPALALTVAQVKVVHWIRIHPSCI